MFCHCCVYFCFQNRISSSVSMAYRRLKRQRLVSTDAPIEESKRVEGVLESEELSIFERLIDIDSILTAIVAYCCIWDLIRCEGVSKTSVIWVNNLCPIFFVLTLH